MLPAIDTHLHIWDLSRFQLPWLADIPPLQRSYNLHDYAAASAGLNVVRTVYMEVDVAPAQQTAEVETISALCAQADSPIRAAIISGDPASTGFAAYLDPFRGNPYVKGLRRVLHTAESPRGRCLQPAFVAGVQELGRRGLAFHLTMRPAELADGVRLAQLCPDTTIILDHCGIANPMVVSGAANPGPQASNPFWHTREQWLQDVADLGRLPNTAAKISGMNLAPLPAGWTAAEIAATVNHCIDTFGPDRLMFGGNWPVCTLNTTMAQWTTAVRQAIEHLSEADQRKILHDTAVRLYGLDPA